MAAPKGKKTPAESLADAAEKVVEAAAESSREAIEAMTKAGAGAMVDAFDKASLLGAGQFGKSSEAYETAVALGKRNLDTASAVMQAMYAGVEAYHGRVLEGWMAASAANLAAYERMLGAKTPQDAAAVQMEAFGKLAEGSVTQAVELNRIAADTLAKASAPVKARLDEAFETVAKTAA